MMQDRNGPDSGYLVPEPGTWHLCSISTSQILTRQYCLITDLRVEDVGNAQVMTDDGVHSGIRGARCPIIAVLPYCLVAFPSDYRVA
jgi:hypothetical protein